MNQILKAALVAVILLVASPAVSALDTDLVTQAMIQYKSKQYKQAASLFRKAIKIRSADPTLYYYYASALYYDNDIATAKSIFNHIVHRFPGTVDAERARTVLLSLGEIPPFVQPLTNSPQVMMPPRGPAVTTVEQSSRPPLDDLPDAAKLYFRSEGDHLIVECRFNNRPIDAIFDTGAEGICIGKNHLKQLGLPVPTGAPCGKVQGVGGEPQDMWLMPLTVSVGSMERKNVTVLVQEDLPSMPLLGQSFYRGMAYSIDNSAKCISFSKKAQGGSIYEDPAKAADAVAYTREGNDMIVNVQVNGKTVPMYFDTGASGVLLTAEQAQALGIEVPEDAPSIKSSGIAGTTTCKLVTVQSIRLGQIEKRNFEIAVDMGSKTLHPLLGQSFFSDCRYSIDEHHEVIHLRR